MTTRPSVERPFLDFPEPWRAILSGSDWVDGLSAAAEMTRRNNSNNMTRRPFLRSGPTTSNGSRRVIVGASSGNDIIGEDAGHGGSYRRRLHRQRGLVGLRSTLNGLHHPKAEFRRLVDYLEEPVPYFQTAGRLDVDKG